VPCGAGARLATGRGFRFGIGSIGRIFFSCLSFFYCRLFWCSCGHFWFLGVIVFGAVGIAVLGSPAFRTSLNLVL